jgi:uncharacterized protein YacL
MFNWFKNRIPKKVLDTSILIDGRILGLVESGFLEGDLIVPKFVLYELQSVADSDNELKRKRGRRGISVLEKLQDKGIIKIYEKESSILKEIKETDSKLIMLCKTLNAKLITVDYNLNKVAKIQGVIVLNVNDLNQSLKPPISMGESLWINIHKKGSHKGQGVGFLDDGTMIVVDDAEEMVGEQIKVYVKGITQNEKARIIFAKLYTEGEVS